MDKETIITDFNNCINNRDIDGLSNLMADEYTFIDTENNIRSGKQTGIKDWLGFFGMFPDYRNTFEEFITGDDMIIVLGHSTCADERLAGPAIWTAKINNKYPNGVCMKILLKIEES
jgi:ketosteroid isomerase-like protein